MPLLIPDDTVRRLRGVWLGPVAKNGDGVRWPFDARFVAWGVAAGLTPVAGFLLWLVIPLGVLVAILAYAAGWGRSRDWRGAAFTAVGMLTAVLVVPPGATLMPLPWFAAFPAAPVAAVLATRRVMPYVDHDRPVRWWLATVAAELRSPRGKQRPRTFEPGGRD